MQDTVAAVEERLAYSVEETARLLSISRAYAWTLVRSGDLPSVRIGGRVLVRRSRLDAWLDKLDTAS